jgi:hypothetical protein
MKFVIARCHPEGVALRKATASTAKYARQARYATQSKYAGQRAKQYDRIIYN